MTPTPPEPANRRSGPAHPEPTVVGTVVLDAHGTAIQLRDWCGWSTPEDRYWAWAGTDITGTWGDVAQPAVVIHEPTDNGKDRDVR